MLEEQCTIDESSREDGSIKFTNFSVSNKFATLHFEKSLTARLSNEDKQAFANKIRAKAESEAGCRCEREIEATAVKFNNNHHES